MSNDMAWLDEFLDESIPLWKNDPVMFMREVLLFEPDDWQIEVAYDLRDYPRVSVKSGQGVGKTGVEAALLLWFLVCFPFPRIVATAPTKQQLHDVLWAEVDKWMSNSPLLSMLLKWTKTYVYIIGVSVYVILCCAIYGNNAKKCVVILLCLSMSKSYFIGVKFGVFKKLVSYYKKVLDKHFYNI